MDEEFRLETERLRLRPYRLEDLDDLHAMLSDPEHMRGYPEPFDREGSLAWLERQIAGYEDPGYALWIVEGVDEVEIGWHTRPGRKGEGIAPEAAAAARDWAFAHLEIDHLIALVRPENLPSGCVAEKVGMHVDREVDHKGLWHRVYRIDRVTWTRADEGGTR